ncbi:MAG: pyruvate kinase [Bdellovibrionota bacterium]
MNFEKQRRTHVIWSFDSSCLNDQLLKSLDVTKVDAIRIVSEKGEIDKVLSFCQRIKAEVPGAKERLPVLVDLYDHVRATVIELDGPKDLAFGDSVKVSSVKGKGDLTIRTEEWPTLFKKNESVYLGNGMVVAKVKDVSADHAVLDIVQGGTIYPDADVQVPSTTKPVQFESISPEGWRAATDSAIDYLILPSFDSPEELSKIVKKISTQQNAPWLLLKISTKATLDRLDDLLPLVRGVLISRVALSMQMDPAQVPMITKEVIAKCNDYAKITLVASEMLGSMRHNVTPTRAEVSDIANAVFDGADAVVLSEGLAYGKYSVRGLALAIKTIEEAEFQSAGQLMNWVKQHPDITNEIEAVTSSAYKAAYRNQARALVCLTKNGNTALHLASYGSRTPIIAVTMSSDVIRRLRLVRGVIGILLDEAPDIEHVTSIINSMLLHRTGIKAGERYVFVSLTLSSLGTEASNLFTVQTLS